MIHEDAWDVTKSAASATSDGSPMRRSGNHWATFARSSLDMYFSIFSLCTIEGAIAFTRTPNGPNSWGHN